MKPLAHLLSAEPRVLNVTLFPAPEPRDDLLGDATFELELLHLPLDTRVYDDPTFRSLFGAITTLAELHSNRIHPPPCDFHSAHRGWLLDEETLDSMPVHVMILHYPSLESERRFKDSNVLHEGLLLYQDSPESIYQRNFLDTLASLTSYGVQRESLHFRLNLWKPDTGSTTPKQVRCCTIQ